MLSSNKILSEVASLQNKYNTKLRQNTECTLCSTLKIKQTASQHYTLKQNFRHI